MNFLHTKNRIFKFGAQFFSKITKNEKIQQDLLETEGYQKILKSGRPIDKNKPKLSGTITQEQLDKLHKETIARRENSYYG